MKSYIGEKFDILSKWVKDKDVLDVGCVQHGWEKSINEEWVHKFLCSKAESVYGIDILKEDIWILKQLGYRVAVANAEKFHLDRKFDVIFAGELLEHLANFKGFLYSSYNHLRPNGKLIITVPNCHSLLFMCLVIVGKLQVNDEHTCWFDSVTLNQLLERTGFKVVKTYYLHSYTIVNEYKSILSKVFNKICPYKFRDSIMVVAVKNN